MDTSRMSQGQLIAGGAGVLLFIFLFLPWFGDFSGWEGQSSTDIYMLITAVIAVATALTAGGGFYLPGVTLNGATALLGGVATILLIWLVVFDFPEGEDRGIGIILSLIAAAGIAYGGYAAAREEEAPARPERF
jgi:hypothetical protein